MYKQIILGHVIDYFKLKKIPYHKSGKVVTVECPFCKEGKTATLIPHTPKMNCFKCKQKFTLIDYIFKIKKTFFRNISTAKQKSGTTKESKKAKKSFVSIASSWCALWFAPKIDFDCDYDFDCD